MCMIEDRILEDQFQRLILELLNFASTTFDII